MSYFTLQTDPKLFVCGCGRPDCDAPQVDPMLLARLNYLRHKVERPIIVTSGVRCAYYQEKLRKVGKPAAKVSEHVAGQGADLAVASGAERDQLLEAIYGGSRLFRRLGIGPNFLHVGVSSTLPAPNVWTYYSGKGAGRPCCCG